MIKLTPCTNVGVFAPVCSGKTYLMREWLKSENRYVRFDYTGETLREGLEVEHFHQPLPLLDRLENNPWYFRVAYHPGKDVMTHYKWCQRAVWMLDSPRWLAIDEYHRVCPQRAALDPDVESSLRLARHNKLGLIGMSQRPQDVNKLFVDSCRMCVIFRSQEENFLNACAGHWGNAVAEAVENLRPLVYDDATQTVKQVQQCVVVTRDGLAPKIYDFANDKFYQIDNTPFEGEEADALRANMDTQGAPREGVHDDMGAANGEGEV